LLKSAVGAARPSLIRAKERAQAAGRELGQGCPKPRAREPARLGPFLPTLSLVVASMLVGILVAVPSGIIAAMRKDRRVVE
jgi:hypothetical protein